MQKQEIEIIYVHRADLNKTFQHKYIYNINKTGEKTISSYQQTQRLFNPSRRDIQQFGKQNTSNKD